MKRAVTFSPFTRVEGDLHISVEIDAGVVTEAHATGTLYRGFEGLLRGREPLDAVVLTPRICGQCGASHSNAASAALADIAKVQAPPNGVRCRNIIQAVEAILSNLTHFYLSFAPDLAHPRYGEEMGRRFAPVKGTSFRHAIRARKSFLAMLGLFAGKWPNTLALQPGGVTKTMTPAEIWRARGTLREFREFVAERVLGGPLDELLDVDSVDRLHGWLDVDSQARSDLGRFVKTALAAGLDGIGQGPPRFVTGGGYCAPEGGTLFSAGYHDDVLHEFDPEQIVEHAQFSWLEAEPGGRRPLDGDTQPAPDKPQAYTWCKAPRYGEQSAEVGPIARGLVGGTPLAVDLVARHGAGVFTRMLLRLREMVLLVREVDRWLDEVDPEEPFCQATPQIEEGIGVSLVPAPRGMLGHWVHIEKGRIRNYQVVTPTGWNLSPRDTDGRPGPLEEALVGTPVPDPDDALNVAHVVRSFDPCLFCTVH